MIRVFDVLLSLVGIILLTPVFLIIAVWIKVDSKGPAIYRQQRIGLNGRLFSLYKFRTMFTDSDRKGGLTVGARDPRITTVGYYLRKFKIDELPQILNVLFNDMSFVGPRPEIKKYVDLYTPEQRHVLSIKPGITDYASIVYKDENEILGRASDPEHEYINKIMPHKILLNLTYIKKRSVEAYFSILFKTIISIFR